MRSTSYFREGKKGEGLGSGDVMGVFLSSWLERHWRIFDNVRGEEVKFSG